MAGETDLKDAEDGEVAAATLAGTERASTTGPSATAFNDMDYETGLHNSSQAPPATAGKPLSPDRSLLPPEIWHHVFTLCPPRTLGNLLVVNKLFNIYLDPASPVRGETPGAVTPSALQPMEPNAIWQASRRFFWPQMPAPLRSKTELDMWRLACSSKCQSCGKQQRRSQFSTADPRRPGPGSEGVAAIWAFESRLCGPCLVKASVKEIDLLLSSSVPSAIMPALPFVFVTPELDAFSATTLEQAQLPATLPVTKRFPSSHVTALEEEFAQVRDMGQGTVGEWLKGLGGRGSNAQQDASKWEKWQAAGGVARMCSQLYPGYVKASISSLPQKPVAFSSPAPPSLRQAIPQGRHERTAEEVAELKAARKAEIERRALLLDPPLIPDVLRHIPSFQAATHIVAPLDDDAWDRLRPRLLAQRADAQKIWEEEHKAQLKAQEEQQEHTHLETTLATTKEARDRIDQEWEEIQAPLRAQIAGYADDIIRNGWGKGKQVTKELCSRFAVEALLHIRKQFYAQVAKDAAAAIIAGRTPPTDPPEGPFTQKLTLENMKWIFDTKIKPHTEPLRKELFYCSACEGNYKPFGLEGVIQHYAAKHTSALSLGSIVVHWRAEWPEHPPFSATARTVKDPFHPPIPTGFAFNGAAPPYSYPSAGPVPTPPPVPFPPAPGYGYTPPTYNNPYPHQPQPPPLPYQALPAPIPPPFRPQPGYDQQQHHHQNYAPTPALYPPYPPPAIQYSGLAPGQAQGHMHHEGSQNDYHYGPYQGGHGSGPYAPPQAQAPPQTRAYPDLYQTKVEDIARNSREVWRVLGDIRDLPGSVRVFVTIHHLVKRFQSRFYETPPLSMFIDGLSNNKEMRPVRNVNELACKACHLGLGKSTGSEQDRKHFSLPQLANHFQSKHVEPMQVTQMQATSPPLDWAVDMVLLPNPAGLSGFASSANEAQRALLAAALPAAFAVGSGFDTARNDSEQQIPQHEQVKLTKSVSDGLIGDYQSPGPSSHSATPGAVSENDRLPGNGSGSTSSQGSRPKHGRNGLKGHHTATSGKIKRRLPPGPDGVNDLASNKRAKLADRGFKHHEATASTVRAVSPSAAPAEPQRPGPVNVPRGRTPMQQPSRSSQRPASTRPARETDEHRELDIMAALESRLEQPRVPQPYGTQVPPRAAEYSVRRHEPAASSDLQYNSQPYSWRDERERQPEPLPLDSRYRDFDVGHRHSRPAPPEHPEDPHRSQHFDAGSGNPPARRFIHDRHFEAPDDHHGAAVPPLEGDAYRRSHEDAPHMPMSSRPPPPPPVEAYEIVQVIDEHGEYYIRRPVRRAPPEPQPGYYHHDPYDERARGRRAAEGQQQHLYPPDVEHIYASRPSLARGGEEGRGVGVGLPGSGSGFGSGAGSRPADRRADPAYLEEYDPRFPAY